MPKAAGPCRFGVYHLLYGILLDRLDWKQRVRLWSPDSQDYFAGLPGGFSTLVFSGFVAADMLHQALMDTRPREKKQGAAEALYKRYRTELLKRLEVAGRGDLGTASALLEVVNGHLFGCADILRRAAKDFQGIKARRMLPTVLVVGEIYIRLDPFANDHLIDRLEQQGMQVRFAPFVEWLEYTDHLGLSAGRRKGFGAHLSSKLKRRILRRCYRLMAQELDWPARSSVGDIMKTGGDYLRDELWGEAILTVGGALHEWREGLVDGVVSVGPLECMPSKIAENQLYHAAEREGLASLAVYYTSNGCKLRFFAGPEHR